MEEATQPSLGDLMRTLTDTVTKINGIVKAQGLDKELAWLTEHRKVLSSDQAGWTEFMSRASKFDQEMHQKDPSFSLTKYWDAINASEQQGSK